MVITVNDYKEIRRRWLEGESQRSIARSLGLSRNTVKKYCKGDSVPWERKAYTRDADVLTREVKEFIEECIRADAEEGTPKQKHTARRIYTRLVAEKGFTGGESTVRRYVREIKGRVREAFVPLAFAPGDAMQIDWGECSIYLSGQKQTVNLFCARLCYSDAPFVAAYRRQNSESFLDALVQTLQYFDGTPKRVIFDNAKVAVKNGFGANAEATDSYAALSAHYGFEPVFCNIASGNEKGLVEGLVGFSRRNFCVPIPRVESMEELNAMLREQCQRYMAHQVQGKEASVGALYETERTALYPLPAYAYDPGRRAETRVSLYSTVRYDTNSYSVPVRFCGKTVTVRALPNRIEVYSAGEMVASHQRCFLHQQSIYCLEHYLPLLEQKGRAIFQARPVQDNVPEYFLDWLKKQKLSPKELVKLLRLSLEIGFEAVMQGQRQSIPDQTEAIEDKVLVATVDLTAYDALCARREGVCT